MRNAALHEVHITYSVTLSSTTALAGGPPKFDPGGNVGADVFTTGDVTAAICADAFAPTCADVLDKGAAAISAEIAAVIVLFSIVFSADVFAAIDVAAVAVVVVSGAVSVSVVDASLILCRITELTMGISAFRLCVGCKKLWLLYRRPSENAKNSVATTTKAANMVDFEM
jgi:hypothetical protein